MKNKYKIIIRQFIEDSDDGEHGHYEKRCLIEEFTDSELEDYCANNYVFNFKLINKPVETTNEQPNLDCPYDFTSRCTMGRCNCKLKKG